MKMSRGLQRRITARSLLLLLSAICLPAARGEDSGFSSEPRIVIESGGHTGKVGALAFTPDGQQLISVSHDKTIRFWDIKTGECVTVWRPESDFNAGHLFSMTLSANGKTMAVHRERRTNQDDVLLLAVPEGRVERIVAPRPAGRLGSLTMSRDGKYVALMCADHQNEIVISSSLTGEPVSVNREHKDVPISEIKFAPDSQRVLSASVDGYVQIWDPANGSPIKTVRAASSPAMSNAPCAADWDPGGHRVVVSDSSKPELTLLTDEGEQVWSKRLPVASVDQLLFTRRGESILCSALLNGKENGDPQILLLDAANGEVRLRFTRHDSYVSALAVSPDGTLAATAGGEDNVIYVWRLADGTVVHKLNGRGHHTWNIGWDKEGKTVAWSLDHRQLVSTLERGFNLLTREFFVPDNEHQPQDGDWGVVSSEDAQMMVKQKIPVKGQTPSQDRLIDVVETRTVSKGQGLQVLKFEGVWAWVARPGLRLSMPEPTPAPAAPMPKDDAKGAASDSQPSLGPPPRLVPAHEVVPAPGSAPAPPAPAPSATDSKPLPRVDVDPTPATSPPGEGGWIKRHHLKFDGFSGFLRPNWRVYPGLSLRSELDGRRVRFYFWRDGKRISELQSPPGVDYIALSVYANERECINSLQNSLWSNELNTGKVGTEYFGHWGHVSAVNVSPTAPLFLTSSHDQTLRLWMMGRSQPVVSLFVADNDWILWTPDGYYDASPAGERFMGWQVNNGPRELATFHPAVHFRRTRYRPDLIEKRIKAALRGDESALDEDRPAHEVQPPEIEITSPPPLAVVTQGETVEISARAKSRSGTPIRSMTVLVDGRPYNGPDAVARFADDKEVRHTWKIKLGAAQHSIAIQADDGEAKANSKGLDITPSGPEDEARERPNLHVLAVGISDYKQGDLKLDFAAEDARSLEKVLRSRTGSLYNATFNLLPNASRAQILKGLRNFRRSMVRPSDVGIIFFSGHGYRDDKNELFLLPAESKRDEYEIDGVSELEIKSAIDPTATPGRIIVILDACHAGAFGGDRRKAATTDRFIRDLNNDDYGVITLCASMAREFSEESKKLRNGYFTRALVEGLEGKADYNHDNYVTIKELELYVSNRVNEMTSGRQHAVTNCPTSIRDFRLTTLGP